MLRNRFSITSAWLWLGLCVGCTSTPAGDYPLAEEILKASGQLQARFAAGDLLGVADYYRSDGVLVGPAGFRIEGRKAIDTYWSRLNDPVEWRLVTRTIEGGLGLAYQRGTSFLTSRWDGALNTSQVEFLLIWTRELDGEWKIMLDSYWEHTSASPNSGASQAKP